MRYLESHIQFEALLIHKFLKQSSTDTLGAEERPKGITDSIVKRCEMIDMKDME